MGDGSAGLWAYAQTIIEAAVAEGTVGELTSEGWARSIR
jgi:hypothetical protein